MIALETQEGQYEAGTLSVAGRVFGTVEDQWEKRNRTGCHGFRKNQAGTGGSQAAAKGTAGQSSD